MTDTTKLSRQNRRQKRQWQRSKKKCLTGSTHHRHTQGSLKNVSSTPAPLLQRPVFLRPHSGGSCICTGCYPIMGESGSRKAPDALTCVESSPTRYTVDLHISKT